MLTPGVTLSNRYVIDREIGRGGYSIVYRAQDSALGTDVAVKLLVPPPAIAEVARERMRREVMAARDLAHDNIVAVHDFLETDGASYVIMEYVDGLDVARYIEEYGTMSEAEAVKLGREISLALAVAHQRGVLHRDVKPQNILIDRNGKAKLADFGSAKLDGQTTMTHAGGVVGTLSYLAPEILQGRRPDARSDIYALGLTLYYALTGDLPPRPTAQLPPEPERLGYRPSAVSTVVVSRWFDALVARATAAEPSRRQATAGALADTLAQKGSEFDSNPTEELDRCLLCNDVDPLSLNICPQCSGVDGPRADTLLFLDPSADRRAKDRVADTLRSTVRARTIPWVVHGSRALARLPKEAAEGVRERMRQRGVPLRTMRQSLAWAPMPGSYYTMVFGLAVTGALAGLPFTMAPLPLAGLFLCLGQVTLQRPAIRAARRRPALPGGVHQEVVATLATLPDGTARELLAEVVQPAGHLMGRWEEDPESVERMTDVLRAACQAAREIAGLDEYLALPAADLDGAAQQQWSANRRAVEQTRDLLVQQLLEVVSATGAVRNRTSALGAAETDLPALAAALQERGMRQAEALEEIEGFLAESASRASA